MIQFFCDGQLLYDPRNPDYAVYEPKCELEVNKTGSLTFTIRGLGYRVVKNEEQE